MLLVCGRHSVMISRNDFQLLCGNALDVLKTLPDCSVQCCVTSPPYFSLRDYGTGHWEGGDPDCPHCRTSKFSKDDCTGHRAMGEQLQPVGDAIYKSLCQKCGAVRIDSQIGLEETPEQYIARLVDVFHEVKRVLKDNGTLWINIGDSYVSNVSNSHSSINNSIYKQKDLYGIPWMLAFALRADGWYLRQDIIWHKPNPMPESVKDRCTKSHEHLFLLSKSERYLFNSDAMQEDVSTLDERLSDVHSSDGKCLCPSSIKFGGNKYGDSDDTHFNTYSGNNYVYTGKRNKRDVWDICVSSYRDAHFATYPEELVMPCVLAGSSEGDTVLDPFNGSGTTGIVAVRFDRKYIGIDLNSEYIELAYARFDSTFYGTHVLQKVKNLDGYKKALLLNDMEI